MRGARLLGLAAILFALAPARAHAADAIALRVGPNPVAYGNRARLTGTVAPAVGGESVGIYRQEGVRWRQLATVIVRADGSFSYRLKVQRHRFFRASTTDSVGNPLDSAPVSVTVRPSLVTALRGSRTIGERLYVAGRLVPRTAGSLFVIEGDRSRRIRVGSGGEFRAELTTTRLGRYRATVRLLPAPGYIAPGRRTHSVRVKLRPLTVGSKGLAVAWLERSLLELHRYSLPGIDGVYDSATADAVFAFQKVHGLPGTGSVDRRFWEVLRTTGPPVARVRSGDHLEVDKSRQLLLEVRGGKVVSVTHVSTGATGNTPLGHWRVYAKGPGYNALGMYDSLYFLRGFAIHGYSSVPWYPASHGCVRTPIWFASGIYARWGVGSSVYVYA